MKKNADEIISTFCGLIENLSDESKSIWGRCHSKKFDLGFQSGDFPNSFQAGIQATTVERMTKLGAKIVITIYPKSE